MQSNRTYSNAVLITMAAKAAGNFVTLGMSLSKNKPQRKKMRVTYKRVQNIPTTHQWMAIYQTNILTEIVTAMLASIQASVGPFIQWVV